MIRQAGRQSGSGSMQQSTCTHSFPPLRRADWELVPRTDYETELAANAQVPSSTLTFATLCKLRLLHLHFPVLQRRAIIQHCWQGALNTWDVYIKAKHCNKTLLLLFGNWISSSDSTRLVNQGVVLTGLLTIPIRRWLLVARAALQMEMHFW